MVDVLPISLAPPEALGQVQFNSGNVPLPVGLPDENGAILVKSRF